jgi:hypothetical protein
MTPKAANPGSHCRPPTSSSSTPEEPFLVGICSNLVSNLASSLTPPQGTFLLLDAAALGFAAAILYLRYAPAPLYESDDVVTSALLPVVTAAVDGLWVAALCVFHLDCTMVPASDPATGPDCYSIFITQLPSSRNQSVSYLRLLFSLYCISVSARRTPLDRIIYFPG